MLRTARRLAGAVKPLGITPQVRTFVAAKLPDLDYDYGALEPVITGEIMQLHHSKHHNTYVTNLTWRWRSTPRRRSRATTPR